MPDVLYTEHGKVALITLHRPTTLNSFTRRMHHQLWQALDAASANPDIRAAVITGAGRAFCAGADLGEFDLTPGEDLVQRADPGPIIEQAFNPTARRMQAMRMPTIAAVNGVAAGAGASLALSCDVVLAAPQARFIQAFSKIGLIPDAGSSWLMPHRLGQARALYLAMTGDSLSATQARDWGLIWDVTDEPVAAAMSLAERLAEMPTAALVATRALIRDSAGRGLDAQLDAERDAQSAMGRTHDYLEGVRAFLEKRPAKFQGR